MEAWISISLLIVAMMVFSIFGGEKRKEHKKDSEIIYGSGAFRQSKNCKHPNEYICVKCGDCGRKFVK